MLTAGTVLTAMTLFLGMGRVADGLGTALAAEARMAQYSILSTRVSTFLVIATEAVQSGLPADTRAERVAPVVENIHATFAQLEADLGRAVAAAEDAGLDQQSRFGTQSLGLARMRALLDSTVRGLAAPGQDRDGLRAHLDSFASNFDPLLNQAVNTEVLLRREALERVENLRGTLSLLAIVMAVLALVMVLAFYFGLIRPQFRRLDRLRQAARQIRREDFAIALHDTRRDEIGLLYAETERMAQALARRQEAVQAEWARLSETVDRRTEELRAANARLERADETRRRLFADISHELRTPLTVILMEAEIGRAAFPEGRDAFATIETRATRLNRRIDDLLRVARSDTGELRLDPRPVFLPDLFAEVVEEVGAECDNAGLTLTAQDPPHQRVSADPNWLRQIVSGLVRNAIRHARAGGAIHLAARTDADRIEIAVLDNGAGIAPDRQAAIFDRFTQGGENSQGFGIGLALAKWVIEAQSGHIAVQSPLPRDEALGDAPGTKVSLRLPREPD
ncbi:ATP-binding protein [Citreimonas sp.]|uniref:ATP-binding protein n=1 Tax=Citreimonas sp. TaxID=3036715 RepID=UPI00405A1419